MATLVRSSISPVNSVMVYDGSDNPYLLTHDGSNLYLYGSLDGTPNLLSTQAYTTLGHDSGIAWIDAICDGTDIWVVTMDTDGDVSDVPTWNKWNLSGSSWGTWTNIGGTIFTNGITNAEYQRCAIDLTTDGDLLVVLPDSIKDKGVPYYQIKLHRYSSSTWQTPELITTTATAHHRIFGILSTGATANAIIVTFHDGSNSAYRSRTSGSWGSVVTENPTGVGSTGYYSGRYRILYDGASPSKFNIDNSIPGNLYRNATDTTINTNQYIAAIYINSTEYVLTVSTSDTSQLILNDYVSSWGSTVVEDEAGAVTNPVLSWAYNFRSNLPTDKLGYCYSYNGNLYYSEYAFSAAVEITLDTAALTLAGQALSPKTALTVALDTAALTLAGQALSPRTPQTVNLNTAEITITGEVLGVKIPVTVNLSTAQVIITGEILDALTALSIQLNTAQITVAGETVSPKTAIAINLSTAQITTAGEILDVQSPNTVNLSTAQISVAGEILTVESLVAVNLQTAGITVAGELITPRTPNTITLNTAPLTVAGEILKAKTTETIFLNTAQITVAGEILTPKVLVSVNLQTALIAIQGQSLAVRTPTVVNLQTAQISLAGQAINPVSAVYVQLSTAEITVAGQGITPRTPTLVQIQTAQISLAGQAISVGSGVAVNLNTAELTLAGQGLIIRATTGINLNTAALSLQGQPLAPRTPLSILLQSANLTAQGEPLAIGVGLSVLLSTAILTLTGQVFTVDTITPYGVVVMTPNIRYFADLEPRSRSFDLDPLPREFDDLTPQEKPDEPEV